MKLSGILPYARELLEKTVSPGDVAVDCTAGNGNDTLFLAKFVGKKGHVYSFDIQEAAIAATKKRLEEHGEIEQVTLVNQGHEHLADVIPEQQFPKLKGAIFNLGYLPGGDKSIVTTPASTIQAITQLIGCMPKEAIIVLVIYHGHEEGKIERDAVINFVADIDPKKAHVLRYEFINQINNPPFIIAIEKR